MATPHHRTRSTATVDENIREIRRWEEHALHVRSRAERVSDRSLLSQAAERAHLDLQVDLLAEREMTVVLQLLEAIATHLSVKVTLGRDQVRDLLRKTDIHQLTVKVDDEPAPEHQHKPK